MLCCKKKKKDGGGTDTGREGIQVAQGIKSLPSKFEDLSSLLGTLMVEGENWLLKAVL